MIVFRTEFWTVAVLYVIFVVTAPMVTSTLNSFAAGLIGRIPSSSSTEFLQSLAQEHLSQAAIIIYSFWVCRDLLRRSSKVEPVSGLTLMEWDLYKADEETAYRGAAQLSLMSPLPLLVALYTPGNADLLKKYSPVDVTLSCASADVVLLLLLHAFFMFQVVTWSLDSIKGAHRRTRYMYEQQDAVLRQATADLLQRAPGHELQSPANKLFQNAREHAASPDPALQPVVDQVVADEELAHANDFWKFFALPIAINLLLEACDVLDNRFAAATSPAGSVFHFLRSNAYTASAYAFVSAHVGRCLAVVCSLVLLKWSCRYSSDSMQRFSYWLPSSTARICLSGLHPATLVILLFHKQLMQVPTVADASNLVLGYAFVHAGLVYTVMSFACESSVTVATSGAIVMNMNLQEHQDRVLVKKRPYAGRASSPDAGG